MPTYEYRCAICTAEASRFQSISEYNNAPQIPYCVHGGEMCLMERKLSVNPAFSGLANSLAGDRHYDGTRASDGTDISSRTKHREYMKRNGLATADDFKETWSKAEKERAAIRAGDAPDPERRKVLEEAVYTAIQK